MKALITGASSGIGRDIAKILSKKGYDLALVSRDEEKLQNDAFLRRNALLRLGAPARPRYHTGKAGDRAL